MIPEADFPMLFPKKTLNRNPIKANNKSKAKFVFIIVYPLSFKLLMSIEPKFLNIETRMANLRQLRQQLQP
jgi:hypothetical protein